MAEENLSELAVLVNMAHQYYAAGREEEAGAVASRIIQATAIPIMPQEKAARSEAFNFLAAQAAKHSQLGTAMDYFHQAISLAQNPDDITQYRMNLVRICLQIAWHRRARQEADRCVKMASPGIRAMALRMSAAVAREEGDGKRCLAEYRQSAALLPDDTGAQLELAAILADMTYLDEAEEIYRKAATKDNPHYAEGEHGIGLCLMRKMQCAEAIEHFNKTLELDPSIGMAHWNRSISYLTIGDYENGWRDHEFRFKIGSMMGGVATPAQRFQRAWWDGKPASDGGSKRLHIHSEMGLGDTLQFCRYALIARDMEHDVRIETAHELVGLLRDSLPGIAVTEQAMDWPGGYGLADFDCHAPMMSLPMMVGTTLETVPWDGPYLRASRQKIEEWRERMGTTDRVRVGICWHGRSREQLWVKELDRRRSIDFQLFHHRFDRIDAEFISLDVNPNPDGRSWPELSEYAGEIHDFTDTAGIIANLDLVISVDTSVLHLAAGMGKETWLLNRWDSCWRWMDEGDATPWYPSMTIYRQETQGDWDSVMKRVANDLEVFIRNRTREEAAC